MAFFQEKIAVCAPVLQMLQNVCYTKMPKRVKHTAAMVPVYLYGIGAERINGVLDNTELALRLAGTLGLR